MEDYRPVWMSLLTVTKRRPSSRTVITVFCALLVWPTLAGAETADHLRTTQQRDESPAESSFLREVPALELSYPNASVVAWREPFNAAALHLDSPAYAVAPPSRRASAGADSLHRALSEWAQPGNPPLNPSWLDFDSKQPTTLPKQLRLSAADRDRSWWARWHSSLWGVSASMGALMFGMVATLSLLPHDVSGWNKPNFYGLKRTFTSGPSFDYDHYYFNYLAHPYDGSEFYLAARNRDCNWWQSFLYAAAVSSAFEFVIESAYEGASWQDLWITPVSGAVIGELRWQAKKALENPKTGKPVGTANKILYVVVDPLDAIFNL